MEGRVVGRELVVRTDISRRGFLGGLAAGAAVLVVASPAQAILPRDGDPMPTIVGRRREDMLRLTITPFNMTIDKATGRVTPNGNNGLLIVNFGPQAVTEQAVRTGQSVARNAAPARLAGDSQLSFVVDESVSLTLSSLLAWAEREPYVSELGRYLDGEVLPANLDWGKQPNQYFTRLEMPWWLWLSPHRISAWTEQRTPKTDRGRTEIFHTRLATNMPGEGLTEDPTLRTVRGIWISDPLATSLLSDPSRDVSVGSTGYPFEMIPTPRDRADIVRLSTRTGDNQVGGQAAAIKARIALSALGGQLVAEGAWDEPGVSNMTAWQQRIWQGRDTYAKVVRRGFLYPWGFKAAQIEEGVRVFRADAGGTIRAFWEKRTSIAITEPEVNIVDRSTATDAGRRAALFSSVTCLTVQTPPLVISRSTPNIGPEWAGLNAYTPKVATRTGTTPFQFDLVGLDPDGNEIPFTQPLLFAEAKVQDGRTASPSQRRRVDGRFDLDDLTDPNFTEEGAAQLSRYYDDNVPYGDKVAEFGGAAIAYAENLANSVTSDDGEVLSEALMSNQTVQQTKEALFGLGAAFEESVATVRGDVEDFLAENDPRNLPAFKEGKIWLEDQQRMLEEEVEALVAYPKEFIEDAWDETKNASQVYLKALEEEGNEALAALGFPGDKGGGVLSGKMSVGALSRTYGTIQGKYDDMKDLLADGKITPGEAFKAMKILGGVTLADLMPNPFPAIDPDGKPTDKVLITTSDFVDPGLPSERLEVRMHMEVRAFLTFRFEVPQGASAQTTFTAPEGSVFSTTEYVEAEINGVPVSRPSVSSDRKTITLSPAAAGSTVIVRSYPDPVDGEDRYRNFFYSTDLLNVDRSVLSLDLETIVPTGGYSVSTRARRSRELERSGGVVRARAGEGPAPQASWKVRGELSDFVVNLVPVDGLEFVKVYADRIVFTAGSGKSPDVDVDIREIDFSGLLTLLKTLAAYLPFGDLLIIDVKRSGLTAGFMIQLPDIALGAFAISGIGVGAELSIPFDSKPVRFGFLMSRPENPFTLTITGLGGGGYLDQALGLAGIERLSITGFVAAEAKVDFGVASGGVSVRAGFTFAIGPVPEPAGQEGLTLTAFASLNGHVSVLGIASATIDVYIGLSVIVPAELPAHVLLKGVASVSVRVSVALFSKTVNFNAERTIKGTYLEGSSGARAIGARSSDEVPVATFADAWSDSAWAEFCGAFG